MARRSNRFDVQVVFPDFAFGIKNRTDVEITPAIVADQLEEFCRRIRNGGRLPAKENDSARPDLLAALKQLTESKVYVDNGYCSCCHGYWPNEHLDDCVGAQALGAIAKAEGQS